MTGKVGIVNNEQNTEISISHLPNNKKPCLYIQKNNCITKVATFSSEEIADWFIKQAKIFFGSL